MKKLIALLLALAMMLTIVACGEKAPAETKAPEANKPAETKAPEAEKPAEAEEVTIEVWIAQVDWADAWDAMEAKFEEEYPNIKVEHVGLGEDTTFLTTRIAANDLPDVIQCNNNQNMDTMVAGNMLTDLSSWEVASLMPDTYKNAFTHGGKFVGMCQGAAFSCMFYNMDILAEAGWTEVPKNWTELMQCCADIEAKTDAAPLVTAAGKTTTSWMILELVLANLLNDAAAVQAYQDDFKNGTFDWAGVPGLVERMDQIAPYFLEGSASMLEEDAATAMGDGLAAMCLAGNWNAGMISGVVENISASLPPFGDSVNWISNSPEDAFCVTENPNRTAAEQAAVETFFNWLFVGENFAYIQNARGTVPVVTSMTEDQIKLPECMIPVAAQMGAAPATLMGFNLWAAEFSDAANGMIKGLLSGDNDAQAMVDKMVEMMPKSYKNQG